MRPEISALVRDLMYPDLTDAPKTLNRPDLRGVQNNLVFIDHQHPEGDWNELAPDQVDSDPGRKSSKSNRHEVFMIMKILQYLGQQVCARCLRFEWYTHPYIPQGYGTDKIVILTPYLGQLRAFQQALKATNDPILNDLDNADLIRAGLGGDIAANKSGNPIRLGTLPLLGSPT
jgi:hypothetical protein